jgi:hypothetical protein
MGVSRQLGFRELIVKRLKLIQLMLDLLQSALGGLIFISLR